jgi:hypothetical protein
MPWLKAIAYAKKKCNMAFDCQPHGGLRDGKEQMLQFRIDQHPMPACGSSWPPEGNPNMKRDAIRSGGTSAIGEQPITLDVLKEKYLKDGEADAPDIYRRVERAFERALRDMRKVVWDRGPVRMGTHEKSDGTRVPMWHDSVVAAIAYAVQTLIAQRAHAVRPSRGMRMKQGSEPPGRSSEPSSPPLSPHLPPLPCLCSQSRRSA